MNIELVRLTGEYKEQLFEMLTEWKNDIIVNHTDMSPWKIWANDFQDFDNYLKNLDTKEGTGNGWVPDTTLFCLDKDRNIFVGAVNIRHYLNDELLALDECKKLGIDKVLMCCDKDNIGSAKSIFRNGGVLENEVEEDGHITQRYWIQL
ncbi:MAG: GNAT family acetyltransferase [Lachnospiraceae bacterium]|nr:GNAT family acetyltransferase [Lachnospiraceae bacterium]